MMNALIFIITLCLGYSVAYAQQNCTLKKDQDGIKVYTCHTDASKFKFIKASFVVHATTSQLMAEILNIDAYNQWQYNTVNPKILKKINDYELIYYTEVEAPWPMSNRDMILHLKIIPNEETGEIKILSYSEADYSMKHEGFIRVPESSAEWIIKPQGKNNLLVNYSIQIDPGGSVPAWMVNMVCAEAPYISFLNLRKRIEQ